MVLLTITKNNIKKKNIIYGYQSKEKFISIYHTEIVILKAIFKAIEPNQKCPELILNENKNNKLIRKMITGLKVIDQKEISKAIRRQLV